MRFCGAQAVTGIARAEFAALLVAAAGWPRPALRTWRLCKAPMPAAVAARIAGQARPGSTRGGNLRA
jgi:hypothetical protein